MLNNTEIVEAFLEAAAMNLRTALQLGATSTEVEVTVQEAYRKAELEVPYCDIHK